MRYAKYLKNCYNAVDRIYALQGNFCDAIFFIEV
jgi:hypothetical protein